MTAPHKRSDICFLLLPGFAPDAIPVLKLRDVLTKQGFPAVATNFFGDQKVKDFSKLTIEETKSGVSALVDDLAGKYEKVIGIGISLGGALLLEHAKKKNKLSGIVSIGTPYRVKNLPLIRLGLFFLPIIDPVSRWLGKGKRWLPLGASKMMVDYLQYEFPKDIEAITTPALLLHSKRDPVTDYRALSEFFDRLGSPRKEVYISENGNHVIDNNPQIVWEQTQRFFKLF